MNPSGCVGAFKSEYCDTLGRGDAGESRVAVRDRCRLGHELEFRCGVEVPGLVGPNKPRPACELRRLRGRPGALSRPLEPLPRFKPPGGVRPVRYLGVATSEDHTAVGPRSEEHTSELRS